MIFGLFSGAMLLAFVKGPVEHEKHPKKKKHALGVIELCTL
jgi:hypothetical protein